MERKIKMNDKIRVKFWRFDNVVVMRVLDMPERYRGKERIALNGKYEIISALFPQIDNRRLCLCGDDRGRDNDYDSYKYTSGAAAATAIAAFRGMIQNLNEDDCECSDKSIEPEVIIAE